MLGFLQVAEQGGGGGKPAGGAGGRDPPLSQPENPGVSLVTEQGGSRWGTFCFIFNFLIF